MGSRSYVKEAIYNIKKQLSQDNLRSNKKLSGPNYLPKIPFSSLDYKSELDISLECNGSQINYFHNLIGVLRWIVELGRIDIPRKRSKCEEHILRRIVFYFILRTQLIRRFCSIIFHFVQLFYSYVLLFLFDVYYIFVSLFFVRIALFHTIFTVLYFMYVSILIHYFIHHSISLFH